MRHLHHVIEPIVGFTFLPIDRSIFRGTLFVVGGALLLMWLIVSRGRQLVHEGGVGVAASFDRLRRLFPHGSLLLLDWRESAWKTPETSISWASVSALRL
jgi:hypothetical protein